MSKLSVGYQLCQDGRESFVDIVKDYRKDIVEIYFSWFDMPSGRAPIGNWNGYIDWSGQEKLESEIKEFRSLGLKLNLLFNANCYGRYAISRYLENRVTSILEHLDDIVDGVDIVTTTSPAIARMVKNKFPDIDVRASVNMRIDHIDAMKYLADIYDSFYVRREYNRNKDYLSQLSEWAKNNSKGLHSLVNSGCLSYCPAQTFHDNMVAHDEELNEVIRMEDWNPHLCWRTFKDQDNWPHILKQTWIRPEDVCNYEEIFETIKVATRMHSHPRIVLQAYSANQYKGNLLDLFEPSFSAIFWPRIIDNGEFPKDWFDVTSKCGHNCAKCHYCNDVFKKVIKEVNTKECSFDPK